MTVDANTQDWTRVKHGILTAEALIVAFERRDADLNWILRELSTLEEIFSNAVDPVDDLEEAALRRLCCALRGALQSCSAQSSAPPRIGLRNGQQFF